MHGKISHGAAGELQHGIENVEYACGTPELLKGEHSKSIGPCIDYLSEFQPLGVVAGITPFNSPAMVPMWMFPLAIVCGSTFILKPSERDPSSTILIAQLLKEVGLPDGVMNVVNGDKEAVDTLLNDQRIKAVSFVGSPPIAEYIYATASINGERCQTLGCAKNHAIVMPDTDMDDMVNQLLGAAFGSSVERCMALSLAVALGDEAANALIAKMTEGMKGLRVGEYGNGSCIFIRDGEAARYFSDNIQVDVVGIDVPLPVPIARHSFGGWKRSLFGDLHAYGPDGVRFYTKRKTITQR